MAKKKHSNLLQNLNTHHLYIIYDFEQRQIFKFGISDKPVNALYTSARLLRQITLFNKVAGSKRFSGRIINFPIEGRLSARRLEDESILKFRTKHGQFPRGNSNHQFLKIHQ